MKFEKIDKKNLVDEVYKQMRTAIDNGDWQEGDRLNSEHRLSTDFAVSRVVIREALQRLRTEKLIITYQGSGSFVSNPQTLATHEREFPKSDSSAAHIVEQDFPELVEFRNCLELQAIKLCVERATDAELSDVATALSNMEAAIGDVEAFSLADYLFHLTIVKGSHNALFVKAIEGCRTHILSCFYQMNRFDDRRTWGLEIHRKTAEKIIQRDVKGAVVAFNHNNEYNHVRLLAYLNQADEVNKVT